MTRHDRKTGTREWSEHSVNVCRGCAHGCLYCYGRANALRFGRISKGKSWTNEVVNADAAVKRYPLYEGRVMFPTTHDITLSNAGACLAVLVSLLRAGNDVLVVSKAGLHVPALLGVARGLVSTAHSTTPVPLELRVSLTCLNPERARFWEPGAPTPGERLDALRAARDAGFPTSVSIEPLLEAENFKGIVLAAQDAGVRGEIWIGAANHLRARTAWCRGLPGLEEEIRRIQAGQTPEKMREIYAALKGNPQVRWKDSYQKALGIDAMGRARGDSDFSCNRLASW